MKKLVVFSCGLVVAGSAALIGGGVAISQPAQPSAVQRDRRAVRQGAGDPQEPGREGVLRRARPAACSRSRHAWSTSRRSTSSGRMLLTLDCTQAAADQIKAMGPSGGPTVGANGITTVTPTPVVPIAGAPGAGARMAAHAGDPGGPRSPGSNRHAAGDALTLDLGTSAASVLFRPCRWPLVQTFAGYTIVRLLGSGGMGEVYLAQHPRLPRQDALKVLPADGVRRRRVPAAVQPRGRHRRDAVASPHRRRARPRRVRRPALDLDGLRRGHRRRPSCMRRALPRRPAATRGRRHHHRASPRRWTTHTSAISCTAT